MSKNKGKINHNRLIDIALNQQLGHLQPQPKLPKWMAKTLKTQERLQEVKN
jgi:hypothetical protein